MSEAALLKRLELMEKELNALKQNQALRTIHEKQDSALREIREQSMFAALTKVPHHHEDGDYPRAMYRDSGRVTREEKWGNGEIKVPAGNPIIEYCHAESAEHHAELLAQGWTNDDPRNRPVEPKRELVGAKK